MAKNSLSTVWIVTDGKAGMESQCLGLAEALGLDATMKRVKLRAPWRQLSPYLRIGNGLAYSPRGDLLEPPWPDLLIASGRKSVAASLYVKRKNPRTVTVQIQDPVIAPSHFDLVIVPEHDRLSGPNVVQTLGALHRVTQAKLEPEAAKLARTIGDLPRPYTGVLIGGPNAAYRFEEKEMRALASALLQTAKDTGGALLITPSRRTGKQKTELLKAMLADTPAYIWTGIWGGAGDNPYFGILGLADQLIVTSDSVNMISEAMATKKPVHVFDLPGGSTKFDRFHACLRERGAVHRYTGRLEEQTPAAPADDMTRATEAVRRFFSG